MHSVVMVSQPPRWGSAPKMSSLLFEAAQNFDFQQLYANPKTILGSLFMCMYNFMPHFVSIREISVSFISEAHIFHHSAEMDWDQSKENFQPLKEGRKMEDLEHHAKAPLLSSELEARKRCRPRPDSASVTDTELFRRQYEQTVADYDGEDPIVPWLRFFSSLVFLQIFRPSHSIFSISPHH